MYLEKNPSALISTQCHLGYHLTWANHAHPLHFPMPGTADEWEKIRSLFLKAFKLQCLISSLFLGNKNLYKPFK